MPIHLGKRKIPIGAAALMIPIAAILDLINIVVDFLTFGIGGIFVDALSAGVFSIWCSHYGASLWSSKNIGWTLLALLFDLFPVTDLTFPWTTRVTMAIITERHPLNLGKNKEKSAYRSPWRL